MAINFNIKYGNLDNFTPEKTKVGDIIFVNNDVSSAIYIGVADGNPIKFAGDYDKFVDLLNEIDPMLGLNSSDGKIVFNSSTSYISDVNNIAEALVLLDKAIKENGDNDETTTGIEAEVIESLFK